MDASEAGSAKICPISGSFSVSSGTKSSGELTGPFPDGLCPRCQDLRIDGRDLDRKRLGIFPTVPYFLDDSLPGLPVLSRSAQHGCNFCTLLKSIILEFVSHDQRNQWLGNSLIRVDPRGGWRPNYTLSRNAGLLYLTVPVRFERRPDLEQTVEYKIYKIRFEVEGDSGNRLNITRRPLDPDPLSQNNVAKLKSWLHRCHAEHEDCRKDRATTRLPTRLLAVGGEPFNQSPRIIVCSEHPTLTDCEQTPYIALSHCWGKGITPMKTEIHSLPDRLRCIPLETMPRTYHDAVLLTRSLGISYLWIDSLCIVQDDKNDWKRESSSMAEVYRNAYLTVCALVTSCNDGLFRGSREPGVKIPFNSRIEEELNGHYFLRFATVSSNHGSGSIMTYCEAIRLSDDVMGSSWSSRGWTFQEELFSTRKLLCSERLIYLDCNMASCSENSTPGKATSKSLPSRLRNDHADLISTWYDLISSYSGRSLTYEQDRFAAVSSLAASFAERNEDKYIAGLWKNDLPYGLLWYRAYDQEDLPDLSDLIKQRTCTSQFVAPSWSWACEGRVSEWPGRDTRHFVQCKVLEAWSETDNINPLGAITGAHLFMEGKLFKISHLSLMWGNGRSFRVESSGATFGKWYLDFDPAKNDLGNWTREWESHGVFMFILTKQVYTEACFGILSGLLLYRKESSDEYLRIGTFEKEYFLGQDPAFLEDAPCCRIRLI